MTEDRSSQPPSASELIAGRRHEQSFADLVDRAFGTDPGAISRGRSLIAAHPAANGPTARSRRPALPLWRSIFAASALAVAAIVVLVGVGGRDRLAPAGGIGAASPASSATIETSVGHSSTDLDALLAAVQGGDSASLDVVIRTYESDLAAVSVGLSQPGADLDAIRAQLKDERTGLGRALQLASAADKGLVIGLQAKLDRILASLGDTPPPVPSGHGNGGGSGNGAGGGSGAGGGNGAGGSPGGNGSGAGSNGNGANGKGHPKVK